MSTEVIIALVVSGMSLIGSIVVFVGSASKNDVEALRGIIQEQRECIDDLHQDKEDLQAWAEKLVAQLVDAGIKPAAFARSERKTQPRRSP